MPEILLCVILHAFYSMSFSNLLFIYFQLCQVLAAAPGPRTHGLYSSKCVDLAPQRHVGFSSLTRTEPQPPALEGGFLTSLFTWEVLSHLVFLLSNMSMSELVRKYLYIIILTTYFMVW